MTMTIPETTAVSALLDRECAINTKLIADAQVAGREAFEASSKAFRAGSWHAFTGRDDKEAAEASVASEVAASTLDYAVDNLVWVTNVVLQATGERVALDSLQAMGRARVLVERTMDTAKAACARALTACGGTK